MASTVIKRAAADADNKSYLVPVLRRWVPMPRPATSRLHRRAMLAGLALVACATAGATYLLVPGGTSVRPVARAAVGPTTPTAREFADNFVGATNAYAEATGDATRISNADCVQASRGNYMCSYSAERPGAPAECHIMQGRWTPNAASTITVTLAGQAARCASLPDALQSLT